MDNVITKFVITVSLLVVSTAVGYGARRLRLVRERLAETLMTVMAVGGYTCVAFLSIWKRPPDLTDAWLPAIGTVHVVILAVVGLLLGRLLSRDRRQVGVFGIASAMGNNGFTMGGFIIYMLFQEEGLRLVSVLTLMWMPLVVLLLYPIARHHAPGNQGKSLGRVILRSIFDWRSICLPAGLVAILLAAYGPARPEAIGRYRIVDILIFAMTAVAYFSIGLRLHVSHVREFWKMIVALAGVRFGLAMGVGMLLIHLTTLTPLPLTGMARKVLIIECFVPTAVTMVAISNMFRIQPRLGSLLFVSNTLLYLVLVLPWVLWKFG